MKEAGKKTEADISEYRGMSTGSRANIIRSRLSGEVGSQKKY
jgi:hypothetical protein